MVLLGLLEPDGTDKIFGFTIELILTADFSWLMVGSSHIASVMTVIFYFQGRPIVRIHSALNKQASTSIEFS